MNDLSGLSWDNKPSTSVSARNQSQFPVTRPSPLPTPAISRTISPLSFQASGRNTPVSGAQQSTKTVSQDSFASLLGPSNTKKTLTLQERQKQLLEEKARQATGQVPGSSETHYAGDEKFWEGLGGGRNTPAQAGIPPPRPGNASLLNDDEDDLLAGFSASAPVDASSHYPPPLPGTSRTATPDAFSTSQSRQSSPLKSMNAASARGPVPPPHIIEDDDPFGLNQFEQKRQAAISQAVAEDDDDILGMLGRPVTERPRKADPARAPLDSDSDDDYRPNASGDPRDAAIAELVDMGFAADKARDALEATDFDVQSAVGLILNQAHEESRNRQQSRQNTGPRPQEQQPRRQQPERINSRGRDDAIPSWVREETGQRRQDSRSPASSERDVAQYATELGNSLFKSANSLFKAGRKQVQKAMADFQEVDGGQPRWMQAADRSNRQEPRASHATDEAMMLESGRSTPALRQERRPEPLREQFPPDLSRRQSPFDQRPREPRRDEPIQRQPARPAEKLSRALVEEQAAEAYVSSARRRKPQAPKPPEAEQPSKPTQPPRPAEPELDIFADAQPAPASAQPRQTSSRPAASLPIRPKASNRPMPSVAPSILSASAASRQKGTEAFKRGDYGEAQTHYSSALSGLPPSHPITIVILCNRALTGIKTGDPKAAVADADAALKTIGPSRGEDESITIGDGEGEKPMKEFYGKALMRKAEAYEHMEKWNDAAGVWREAVEAGVGGNVAMQGRNRCEKAAGGGSSAPQRNGTPVASAPPARISATQPPRRAIPAASNLTNGQDSEAVKRLRKANEEAAKASDEAFALNDAVEARLNGWKSGKEGNLRALLASLDTVLWPEAGWKKVGMGDLVMPNKVKVIYMKAIAKVHPDKLSQEATTEQKMISASVFANLNEAWDKFKKDNNL